MRSQLDTASHLVLLRRSLAAQPQDHVLFVLVVHRDVQLILSHLLAVAPNDVLPSKPTSKLKIFNQYLVSLDTLCGK